MKRATWFLYDAGSSHPYFNMAMDEVLLTRRQGGEVVVRLYAWEPPGLSLGYFQKRSSLKEIPAFHEEGAVMTRRLTGGDAIFHINELTFSLVGEDKAVPFQDSVESSYHRIHLALAAGFELLGIASSLRTDQETIDVEPGRREGRCFYRVTRYDLVAGRKKLVGSAQRRTQGRVLHHGSIPLAPNPMTPEAADLSTLSGRPVSYEDAAHLVRQGMERAFDIRFESWRPDADIIEAAESLALEKYGARTWIERR